MLAQVSSYTISSASQTQRGGHTHCIRDIVVLAIRSNAALHRTRGERGIHRLGSSVCPGGIPQRRGRSIVTVRGLRLNANAVPVSVVDVRAVLTNGRVPVEAVKSASSFFRGTPEKTEGDAHKSSMSIHVEYRNTMLLQSSYWLAWYQLLPMIPVSSGRPGTSGG